MTNGWSWDVFWWSVKPKDYLGHIGRPGGINLGGTFWDKCDAMKAYICAVWEGYAPVMYENHYGESHKMWEAKWDLGVNDETVEALPF